MIYLDTNVLVYAIENHPQYGKACAKILRDIQNETLRAGASVLVLVELLNVLKKLNKILQERGQKPLSLEENIQAVLSLPVTWLELDLFTVQKAATYSFSIAGADYIHVAAMEVHGLTEILSADREMDRVKTIHRIDPLEYGSRAPKSGKK